MRHTHSVLLDLERFNRAARERSSGRRFAGTRLIPLTAGPVLMPQSHSERLGEARDR